MQYHELCSTYYIEQMWSQLLLGADTSDRPNTQASSFGVRRALYVCLNVRSCNLKFEHQYCGWNAMMTNLLV